MLDGISDSFLLQAASVNSDSMHSGINIADLILDDTPSHQIASAPNVLSQVLDADCAVIAGQIETSDGQVLPLSIGQTDIGNGKPVPYIHISDDPTVLSRHVTITTVQTNDGKFRAMLRVNHPHGRVILGGSVVRPETVYPVLDDDEIIVGDGVRFKLRLNNRSPQQASRRSIVAPTPHYIAAPNSEEIYETEEREMEEKRRQFQERLTPPNDDALLLQLAAASDPSSHALVAENGSVILIHQMGDTCPYSSGRESTSQPIAEVFDAKEHLLTDEGTSAHSVTGTPMQEVTDEGNQACVGDVFVEDDNRQLEPAFTQTPQEEPSIMSEGTEPPLNTNDENRTPSLDGELVQVHPPAPQLSQQEDFQGSGPQVSLMDRLKAKRGIDDERIEPKKKLKKFNTPPPEHRSLRSSVTNACPTGPKKLTILKTAVDIDRQTESAISSVGAKLETKWTEKVDALVTGSIVRTTKFLCAINKGLAIFPKSVLNDIKTFKALPPTDQPDLWLKDPDGERKYDFVLRDSILRARQKPLLDGLDVYCFKNSIGEFSSDELRDLITTAGGKVLSRLPKPLPDNGSVLLIGNDANAAAARSAGASKMNKIEFLVDACIKQRLDLNFAQVDLGK
jgi:hypothetical protein